jgi:hypothetical protein
VGVALSLAGVAGLAAVMGAVAVGITLRTGGTVRGGLRRTLAFGLSTYSALQVVVQVARSAPASVPPAIQSVFAVLRALQYEGVRTVPLACTALPPFAVPSGLMAAALCLMALWLLSFACWRARLLPSRTAPSARAQKLSPPTPGGTAGAAARGCLALGSRALQSLSYWTVAVSGMVFAIVANTAFSALICRSATMTLQQYRYLRADGSAAAAGLGMSAGEAMRTQDAALLSRSFPVSLLASDPSIVCFEGDHSGAFSLATATLAAFTVGLPLLSWLLVRCVALPAVMARAHVPRVLLEKRLPHVCYGGAFTGLVLAHELGAAAGRRASVTKLERRRPSQTRSGRIGFGARCANLLRCRGSGKRPAAAAPDALAAAAESAAPPALQPQSQPSLAPSDVTELQLLRALRRLASARQRQYVHAAPGGCFASADATYRNVDRCHGACAALRRVNRQAAVSLCGVGQRFFPPSLTSAVSRGGTLQFSYPASLAAGTHSSMEGAAAGAALGPAAKGAPLTARRGSGAGVGKAAAGGFPAAAAADGIGDGKQMAPQAGGEAHRPVRRSFLALNLRSLVQAAGPQGRRGSGSGGDAAETPTAGSAVSQPCGTPLQPNAGSPGRGGQRSSVFSFQSPAVDASASAAASLARGAGAHAGAALRRTSSGSLRTPSGRLVSATTAPAPPVRLQQQQQAQAQHNASLRSQALIRGFGGSHHANKLVSQARQLNAAAAASAAARAGTKTGASSAAADGVALLDKSAADAAAPLAASRAQRTGSGGKQSGIGAGPAALAGGPRSGSKNGLGGQPSLRSRRLVTLADGSVMAVQLDEEEEDDAGGADGAAAAGGRGGSGDPVYYTAAVTVPLLGCPCCCVRVYPRRAHTPADLVDSSPALAAPEQAVIAYFSGGGEFRASQLQFVQVTWGLLALLAGAAQYPTQGSPPLHFLARGLLVCAACVAIAAWQLAASPDVPSKQWMLPVRLYILLVTGVGWLYTSLGAAFAASQAQQQGAAGGDHDWIAGLGPSLEGFAYLITALCALLLPFIVAVFVLSLLVGATAERRELREHESAAAEARAEVLQERAAALGASAHRRLSATSGSGRGSSLLAGGGAGGAADSGGGTELKSAPVSPRGPRTSVHRAARMQAAPLSTQRTPGQPQRGWDGPEGAGDGSETGFVAGQRNPLWQAEPVAFGAAGGRGRVGAGAAPSVDAESDPDAGAALSRRDLRGTLAVGAEEDVDDDAARLGASRRQLRGVARKSLNPTFTAARRVRSGKR